MKTMDIDHSSIDLRVRSADQKFSYETEPNEPCGQEVKEKFSTARRQSADTVQVTKLTPQIARKWGTCWC